MAAGPSWEGSTGVDSEVAMMAEEMRYYTRADLRGRGWPPDLIARLLGPPDVLAPPLRSGGERQKLYAAERVESMERTAAFQAAAERLAANRARKRRGLRASENTEQEA